MDQNRFSAFGFFGSNIDRGLCAIFLELYSSYNAQIIILLTILPSNFQNASCEREEVRNNSNLSDDGCHAIFDKLIFSTSSTAAVIHLYTLRIMS